MIRRIIPVSQMFRISIKVSFKRKGKQALINIKMKSLLKYKKELIIIITCQANLEVYTLLNKI